MHPYFAHNVFAIARVLPQGTILLGTGFLVSSTLVASTRHVVGDDDKGLCVFRPKVLNPDEYQDTTDLSSQSSPATLKEVDPIRDLAILSVPIYYFSSILPLGSFDDTPVGEMLQIWGYPHAPDGRLVLTQQMATVGAKVLLGSQGLKSKHAIINTQTRPGQSGSLVYGPKAGKIVGLLIGAYANTQVGTMMVGGINLSELHQTTHCISAEYIRDML